MRLYVNQLCGWPPGEENESYELQIENREYWISGYRNRKVRELSEVRIFEFDWARSNTILPFTEQNGKRKRKIMYISHRNDSRGAGNHA